MKLLCNLFLNQKKKKKKKSMVFLVIGRLSNLSVLVVHLDSFSVCPQPYAVFYRNK